MGATSTNFSKELACHHCGVNNCTQELVDVLETFRHAAGDVPVLVNDAFRCAVHNAEVGGAPHSEHVQGIAADICIKGMTAAQLEAIARRIPAIKGIGRNDFKHFLHIDIRPTKNQWCYAESGVTCNYYPPKI